MPAARAELAPAKINLTLRVIGRRSDGYHDIESLVVFAALGDALSLTCGRDLSLIVRGPTAAASGALGDNLVLKAARQLSDRVAGLKLGQFVLSKRLPVAAGMGGGSADAAAALRLLARANGIAQDDSRLMAAACASGADVPVCLDPRPRRMRGIGEILSDPLDLPRLPAVLVNPRVAVPTKDVFAALRFGRAKDAGASAPSPLVGEGQGRGGAWVAGGSSSHDPTPNPSPSQVGPARLAQLNVDPGQARDPGGGESGQPSDGRKRSEALLRAIAEDRNDLEAPAIALQPIIAAVLNALRVGAGCRLARMSGSGATCFGLFDSARAATAAAQQLRATNPDWWIRATVLG